MNELPMNVKINCCGATHVGQRRVNNEDQFLIADLSKSMKVQQTSLGLNHSARLYGEVQGKLLLVADGLGGHESGERASSLAVDGVTNYMLNAMDWLYRIDNTNEQELEAALASAFEWSQHKLEDEARDVPQRRGLATTLTMAYVVWPRLYLAHVGDARCYWLSGNRFRKLTVDHTMGELSRSEAGKVAGGEGPVERQKGPAPRSGMDHVLWNVVGGDGEPPRPDISHHELEIGDALLLCTDGLYEYCSDEELQQRLGMNQPLGEACQSLVDAANERGGKDNITVVMVKFEAAEEHCEEREEFAEVLTAVVASEKV